MTAEWDEVLDAPAVTRLADLYLTLRESDAEPNAALLAQVQRLESELGLSPAARKRMHVKRAQVAEPAPASKPAGDRRQRLRVADS